MPRCTASQIAQSCWLTRSQRSAASLGSNVSFGDLVAGEEQRAGDRGSGRRRAGRARTPRRGRRTRTPSGSGRRGRPCGASRSSSSSPGSGARSVVPVVVNVHAPSRCGMPLSQSRSCRRRRTTAPAATARGAPGRSGSTRCSSRAAPCSWPRRRRSAPARSPGRPGRSWRASRRRARPARRAARARSGVRCTKTNPPQVSTPTGLSANSAGSSARRRAAT